MPRKRILFFVLTFATLTATGLLLLQVPATAPPMWRLKTGIARVVGVGVSACRTPATVEGATIGLPSSSIQIIDECTGVYAFILLTAFVVAYPNPWRRKVTAVLFAIAFVSIVNVLRLVAFALLLDTSPGIAKFAHDYLWQVVWGAALVAFALLYARRPERPFAAVDGS